MQAYNDIDQQIHQLSQTIAKFNRTYVPQKADDSHTNLAFDPIALHLAGRWVESSKGKVIMTLNLEAFQFEIYYGAWRKLQAFDIDGKKPGRDRTIYQRLYSRFRTESGRLYRKTALRNNNI